MEVTPFSAVITVLGGLLLAGILGWIRQSKLVVLMPRQFGHSSISSKGQLVEISVLNRGFRTEEAVEVLLSPNLKYEMVGSNNLDIALDGARLRIPRIGASNDVTALLLVEGGGFSKADIVSCLSKETKADIVSKLEEVPPTGPQRAALVSFFVAISLAMYAIMYAVDYLAESAHRSAPKSVEEIVADVEARSRQLLELHGWTVPQYYQSKAPGIYQDFLNKKIQAIVRPVEKKKNIVTVPVVFINDSDVPTSFHLEIRAAGNQDSIELEDRMRDEVLVMPRTRHESFVKAVVSANAVTESERTVIVDCFLKTAHGDTLSLTTLVLTP